VGLLLFMYLMIGILIYVNGHMFYNRFTKRDELEGLFGWFRKKKKAIMKLETIRRATVEDGDEIQGLLRQLGYDLEPGFVTVRLQNMFHLLYQYNLICEVENQIVGFISMQLVPQIAFSEPIGLICYLVIDEHFRGRGYGAQMEAACVAIARQQRCERIQLHCEAQRVQAHRFYERQGYAETRKYYSKILLRNEKSKNNQGAI
jgi:GNAT superfamily N-acetyltransferase